LVRYVTKVVDAVMDAKQHAVVDDFLYLDPKVST
jgi:hypothetical protein